MNTKSLPLMWGMMILGIALMVFSQTGITDSNQINGICIGFGAALAVLGIGNLAGKYVARAVETPDIQKASLREENDERNIRVRERAGWNTARITNYVLCFLALASALMNLELYITLSFVFLIIMEFSLTAGSLVYYEKRM
ncbi:hypothetical protein L1S32_08395 [Methanogenium sp. S4BF]|uniref:hypothetical protein n=1 Tax=Methanogenium sp. S4BF TaxID=1789226 RepID=UPI0024167E92|nr:hypothetical protein [Methanogenium sp. S4BF]WFN33861.1 hypothetical protein L1S32_08395 [Methanogenium sp. S4BF]